MNIRRTFTVILGILLLSTTFTFSAMAQDQATPVVTYDCLSSVELAQKCQEELTKKDQEIADLMDKCGEACKPVATISAPEPSHNELVISGKEEMTFDDYRSFKKIAINYLACGDGMKEQLQGYEGDLDDLYPQLVNIPIPDLQGVTFEQLVNIARERGATENTSSATEILRYEDQSYTSGLVNCTIINTVEGKN